MAGRKISLDSRPATGGLSPADGPRYEEQAEGGLATSTPQNFELLRPEQQASLASSKLYKVRATERSIDRITLANPNPNPHQELAEDYEKKFEEAAARLQEQMEQERDLRSQ